jgi:hypothetical protein
MDVSCNKNDRGLGRKVYEVQMYPQADPGFIVGMFRLLQPERDRIWDRHQFNPVKSSQAVAQRVLEDTVNETVAYVKGATFNGAPMDGPANKDFLFFMLEQEFEDEVDGQLKSAWTIAFARFNDLIRADTKNSLRVSPGSGAKDSLSGNS